MDGIVFLVFIILVYLYFKNIVNFVYFMAVIDLFLRVIHFLGEKIDLSFLTNLLPSSFEALLGMLFSGIILDVLTWGLYVGYIVLIFFLLRNIFKK